MSHPLLRVIPVLFLLLGGLSSRSLTAQVGFGLPVVNFANTNQIIDLPVTVLNFDTVVSVQYVIRWDPAVLQFQSIQGYNLTDLDGDNFGLTEALDSGIVRLVWWHNGSGVTLPDGTAIFKIRVKVIGANGAGTPVYFTQITPNTYFEVVKHSGQSYNLNTALIDNGFVAVGFMTGTENPETAPGLQVYATPNPVQQDTRVWIELEKAEQLQCVLTNPLGQIVFSQNLQLPSGKHGMEIASYLKGQQGTWYFSVRTPTASRTIPLSAF